MSLTKRNAIIAVCFLGVGIVLGIWSQQKEEKSPSAPGAYQIEGVRNAVTEFGSRMKNVSVLAPKEDFEKSLDREYSHLVTPELLAKWKADPTITPGRQTSSPWPDRIEISSVIQNADDSYTVTGKVIEVTSDGASTEYPVGIVLRNPGNKWLISSFIRTDLPQVNNSTPFLKDDPFLDDLPPVEGEEI